VVEMNYDNLLEIRWCLFKSTIDNYQWRVVLRGKEK